MFALLSLHCSSLGAGYFFWVAPNSLFAQGTSSDFEVVPTEEQNSPPQTGSPPRNMMVSTGKPPEHVPRFPFCHLPPA